MKRVSVLRIPSLRWLRRLLKNRKARVGLVIMSVFVFIAVFAPWIARYNPQDTNFGLLEAPNAKHWFGTTGLGQDVFSQFVWGTRASLSVGVSASVLSTILAVLFGMFPGYRGGVFDRIMATFTNIFMVIPGLPLMIVAAAYVHETSSLVMILIIGLTGWAGRARVLRSQTMTLANRDFVWVARMSGASDLRILMKEILPNMLSLFAASLMYGILGAILAEAGLEFLGLGNLTAVTWGTMLYWANNGGAVLNGAWWWLMPGGLGIAVFGTSMALMNFALDEVTNPRLRPRVGNASRIAAMWAALKATNVNNANGAFEGGGEGQ
ncbi:MAG: ABC transporter permease [Bacilli bacterium]